jgi:DNA-binding transcriptional MerR regulator
VNKKVKQNGLVKKPQFYPMREKYSIRDLEKLTGIKAHTIRIWESRYGILKPERTDTNIRYYSNEELRTLLNISLLNRQGLKISLISKMPPTEVVERLSTLHLIDHDPHQYEENLLLAMIGLEEQKFNKTFVDAVMTLGFERTVTKVIFPFFERIGLMWQTGAINPAQEHFISNLIRQKLIAATDVLTVTPAANAKTVLLFLPEEEEHELGLLFYNYAFRLRGYRTIYLGNSVPQESLPRVAEVCHPDYVVTGMTNLISPRDLGSLASHLAATFPKSTIFYTGSVPANSPARLPRRAHRVKQLIRLLEHASPQPGR